MILFLIINFLLPGLLLVTSIVLLIVGAIQKNKTALIASAVVGLVFLVCLPFMLSSLREAGVRESYEKRTSQS